jgi:hypothetical protein
VVNVKKLGEKKLEALIEEAIVDAYGDEGKRPPYGAA